MASFARSFLGCGGKAGRAGARRPRALSSEVRGGDLSQRKPAPGVHEAGSGCVHKDPYPPLSEAATKLNALLDEIKGKKLNSVPLVMVGKTISNFEIVRREVHFKNIGRSWAITAVLLGGYFTGYCMEEEKTRKKRQSLVN
ncbi:Os02g0163533 [Oryza sativa Japonica Group]|uniref:Os02g0163533 protein n=5 Tax=Oryza TaxID=4527 RepID=A0A0P0VF23_ORYSJ|nr:uncharacterized protein LOC9266559 [Oryza sativa Japonica Group]KAB8085997.1 hypothetical protein EE612_009039 [Oryza sativa]EEE56365.1 hypothetical protein OsJ_05496 [Oryza sativa Japonica Group]KAF2943233.1 hypothetical protein DAI22_02g050600 [Oryza sativa Japonica Group]BAH91543.1 Os02g0163533 [Oryza sativa Japonica Group]BAS77133.1 Os02g0163533 [Oryza sativa Japonica Group]|eukprot:NP_001172814.1 Os02g0163533 [Oryza sativa Japonica Group]